MNKSIISNLFIFLFLTIFTTNCSSVRESAGVSRKSPDEFTVIENPPLVIPPDFGLVAPEQMKENKIENLESELAEEILFGSDKENNLKNNNLSSMNTILDKTKANEVSNEIRKEIDEGIANEIDTKNIFGNLWETEEEVLDAIKESERLRNEQFNKNLSVDD